MRICWDNLNKVYYNSSIQKFSNGKRTWILEENCKNCNNPFLALSESKNMYCDRSCKMMGINNPWFGKEITDEIKRKISKANSGANGPGWKGGIYPLINRIRRSKQHKKWSQEVFVHWDYKCVRCQKRGRTLHAHHVLPFNEIIKMFKIDTIEKALRHPWLWDVDNGMALCKECHYTIHTNQRSEC